MVELTLTLKMTTAQVVGTSVIVNNNSPIQDYLHPEDHTEPTYNLYFVCECLDRSHLNIMVHNQFKFKNKMCKGMASHLFQNSFCQLYHNIVHILCLSLILYLASFLMLCQGFLLDIWHLEKDYRLNFHSVTSIVYSNLSVGILLCRL